MPKVIADGRRGDVGHEHDLLHIKHDWARVPDQPSPRLSTQERSRGRPNHSNGLRPAPSRGHRGYMWSWWRRRQRRPPLRRRAKGSWDKRNAGAPCKRHGRTTAPPPSSENVWSLFRRRTSDMMTLMGKTGVGSARRRFRQRGAALAPCHSAGVHRHRHPICAPSSEDLRRRGSPPADGRAAANAAL